MIRSALAAIAALTAVVAVAPGVATAAAASAPSAELASCTFAPAGGNVAKIAIKHTSADHSVRWVARWVHTDPDGPATRSTRSAGVVTTGNRIIQLRYTDDDLLKFVAKSGHKVLLSVRVDTADGCGVTSGG